MRIAQSIRISGDVVDIVMEDRILFALKTVPEKPFLAPMESILQH
ncbi:hypothetical protein [Gillisia limnaea]